MALSFDEETGSIAHDAIGTHDGSVTGAEWTSSGRHGGALEFSDVNDYVVVLDDPELNFASAFTVSAWVRPTDELVAAPILTKEASEYPSYQLRAGGLVAGVPNGLVWPEESSPVLTSASEPLTTDTWTHLALTYDGSDLRLYADAELVAEESTSSPRMSVGALQIGATQLEEHFEGAIDEVRIYDADLSNADIEADMYAPILAPSLEVTGDLFDAEPASSLSPDSLISIEATAYDAQFEWIHLKNSGVTQRSISVEDEALPDGADESCEGQSCTLLYELTAEIGSNAEAGPNGVEVEIVDTKERGSIVTNDVTLDVDPPSISLTGPLAEADAASVEVESAALHISASDGEGQYDSGISKLEVEVSGESADLVSPPCAPSCPEPTVNEFVFEAEDWGWESKEVTVKAFDEAGNSSADHVMVNSPIAHVEPTCEPITPGNELPANVVSPGEAIEALEESFPGFSEETEVGGPADPDEAINPVLIADPVGPLEEEWLRSAGSLQGGWVGLDAGSSVTMGRVVCAQASETTSAESIATPISGGVAAVRANTAPETDTLFRPSALGVSIVDHFRGEEAPTERTWILSLPPGAELTETPEGGAALIDPAGTSINPTEVPPLPSGWEEPSAIADVHTQLELAAHYVALANEEAEGQVLGIVPPPLSFDAEEGATQLEVSVENGNELVVNRPPGDSALLITLTSAPNPVAMCHQALLEREDGPLRGCEAPFGEEGQHLSNFTWLGDAELLYSLETFSDKPAPPLEEGEDRRQPASGRLYSVQIDGTEMTLISDPRYQYFDPRVSPDKSKIVTTRCSSGVVNCGVYIMDADGSNEKLVYKDQHTSYNFHPHFGKDDSEIFFFRDAPPQGDESFPRRQIYYISSSGTGLRQITEAESIYLCGEPLEECNAGLYWELTDNSFSLSPDGETIVFTHLEEVWTVPADAEKATYGYGNEELARLTPTSSFNERARWPTVSPDGESVLYYFSDLFEPSENGVYAIDISGGEPTQLFKYSDPIGARYPTISPDNESLAFISSNGLNISSPTGEDIESVTDGDESLTYVQAALTGDEGDIAVAVALEERVEELKATLLSSATPNDAELAFCVQNLYNTVECSYFYAAKHRAEQMRDRLFTARHRRDMSTRGNAFQHGFWTALMVRDSLVVDGVSDGLLFALLHEGDPPYSWDSRMDVLNDFVGHKYFQVQPETPSALELCQGILSLARSAIFIGAHINPYRWANRREFKYNNLIFRKLRADRGKGPVVRPNGRTCSGTW